MSNDEFIQTIEKKTGLKIATDFGFIAGTEVPFSNKRGLVSAAPINGFEVWRIKDGKHDSTVMNSQGEEMNLLKIIAFLNS